MSAAIDTILETSDERLYQQYVGKKNTAFAGRTGQLSTDSTSDSLVRSATHSPTDTLGIALDAAKVRNNSPSARNNVKKFKNGDGYVSHKSLSKAYSGLLIISDKAIFRLFVRLILRNNKKKPQMQLRKSIDDIPMLDFQKAVAELLKNMGVSMEMAQGIILAVSSDKWLIGEFMLWVYDNNPTEEQIMHWIVEHT